MSNRLNHSIALTVALSVTGFAVFALTDPRLPAPTPVTIPHEHAVLLPTIVVRPEAEVTELPGITVRPDRAERIAAGLRVTGDEGAPAASGQRTSALLTAGGGLAMPYYSFGKPLLRVNQGMKE